MWIKVTYEPHTIRQAEDLMARSPAELLSKAIHPSEFWTDRHTWIKVAWYADNGEEATHPVGRKMPNAWGLHDMLGNVAEWTEDAYGPYPSAPEDKDPTGPPAGSTRAVRGGSWRAFAPALRCAARTGTPESYQLSHVGLRVVREIR